MMEALAVAVTGLRTDLKDSLKAREPEEKPGPSKTARVTPRKPDCDHGYESSGSDKEGASYWYALVRGKGGVSGVYKDWGEVAPLFLGASGAILNKHKTRKEAEAMVRKYVSSTKGKASKWGNEPDWWYGVSDGKAGSDIYSTWEEAGTNYLGVSGAKVKKFRSYEDAEAFIGRYTIDHPFSEAEIEEGDTETVKKKGEPKGDGAPYQMGFHSAGGYRPGYGLSGTEPLAKDTAYQGGYRPPMVLSGPDPSVKKDDEIFGIDLGSEMDLRTALSPPDLPDGIAKGLASAMVDIVAIPGGFYGGSGDNVDENHSDMTLLGEAMEELVNQGRSQFEGSGKADLHWRSDKRTSLRNLKSLEQLRKRIKVLVKLRDKVVKVTIKAVRNACRRAGWVDIARVDAWSHGGFYTRIIRDSMDGYLSLHQHLLGLATSDAPWKYTQVEIEHHVEEMEIIRNTQDSRLQALCALYAYLRDGQDKNWHSNSLQYKRNMELYSKMSDGGSQASYGDDGGGVHVCEKCQTCLHKGSRNDCPWGHLGDDRAKKEGSRALRRLAEGHPPALGNATPGGKGKGKKGKKKKEEGADSSEE
jgi:viroplasmin and RNaseH domain-containing protein